MFGIGFHQTSCLSVNLSLLLRVLRGPPLSMWGCTLNTGIIFQNGIIELPLSVRALPLFLFFLRSSNCF